MQKSAHFRVDPKLAHVLGESYTSSEKALKELLALDYGREPSFVIFVNGERVFHHDIQCEKFTTEITLPNGQTATVSYTIADKPLHGKKSGLNVRVDGKSMGKPHLFGLENDDALSDRLRRRIVGEINLPADSLERKRHAWDISRRGLICARLADGECGTNRRNYTKSQSSSAVINRTRSFVAL